jgi:hypothetical protein
MICQFCHGTGRRINPRRQALQTYDGLHFPNSGLEPLFIACDKCHGGVASCCDAAGAQGSDRLELDDEDWDLVG